MHHLSDYALEYSTALLMNLSLRTLGKKKAADAGSDKLLRVLTELLSHENIEVRPYANGILYATLQDKRVWDTAHEINLAETLKSFSQKLELEQQQLQNNPDAENNQNSDPTEIKRQFDYILKQLQKTEPPKSNSQKNDDSGDEDEHHLEEEDDEEEDIIEPDLDTHDLSFNNGPVGEEFLDFIGSEEFINQVNRGSGHQPVMTKPMNHTSSRSSSRNSMRPKPPSLHVQSGSRHLDSDLIQTSISTNASTIVNENLPASGRPVNESQLISGQINGSVLNGSIKNSRPVSRSIKTSHVASSVPGRMMPEDEEYAVWGVALFSKAKI